MCTGPSGKSNQKAGGLQVYLLAVTSIETLSPEIKGGGEEIVILIRYNTQLSKNGNSP